MFILLYFTFLLFWYRDNSKHFILQSKVATQFRRSRQLVYKQFRRSFAVLLAEIHNGTFIFAKVMYKTLLVLFFWDTA